jgi:hypothetical protein
MMQRVIWTVALQAGSVGPARADDGFANTFGSQGGGDGQFTFPAAVAVWYFRGRPIARGVSGLSRLRASRLLLLPIRPERATQPAPASGARNHSLVRPIALRAE